MLDAFKFENEDKFTGNEHSMLFSWQNNMCILAINYFRPLLLSYSREAKWKILKFLMKKFLLRSERFTVPCCSNIILIDQCTQDPSHLTWLRSCYWLCLFRTWERGRRARAPSTRRCGGPRSCASRCPGRAPGCPWTTSPTSSRSRWVHVGIYLRHHQLLFVDQNQNNTHFYFEQPHLLYLNTKNYLFCTKQSVPWHHQFHRHNSPQRCIDIQHFGSISKWFY